MLTDKLFEKFFIPKIVTEPNSGCWLWDGCCRDGYGMFSVNRKMLSAHRVSYVHYIGEIPRGAVLDHICRVRCCVNPQHLEPVTNQENVKRGTDLKTHCPQGHAYSGENLVTYKGRHRLCRTCQSIHRKRHEEKKRAANPFAPKTHCIRGHPLSGDNLRIETNGRRRCKTCDRLRKRNFARGNGLTQKGTLLEGEKT